MEVAPPRLDDLPLDLLGPHIWSRLDHPAQKSLRRVNRAMRDITSHFISSLQIDAAGAVGAMLQLAWFPTVAVLRRLCLRLHGEIIKNSSTFLSRFLSDATSNLTRLEKLELHGTVSQPILFNETVSEAISSTCPLLRRLCVQHLQPESMAFAHMARLSSLSIGGMQTANPMAVLRSLSVLTDLKELAFTRAGAATLDLLPSLSKVLVILSGLRSLESLSLHLPSGSDVENDIIQSGIAALCHLSLLTSLSWLDVDADDDNSHLIRMPAILGATELSQLSLLVSLQLQHCTLLSADMRRLVASMPHLTLLGAKKLEAREDCSDLAPQWRTLRLQQGPSLQDYGMLPLGRVEQMEAEYHYWKVSRRYSGDDHDVDDVQVAAEELSRLSIKPIELILGGSLVFVGDVVVGRSVVSVEMIAALRPLANCVAHLDLSSLHVSGSIVEALHDSMPQISCLTLHDCLLKPESYGALSACTGVSELRFENLSEAGQGLTGPTSAKPSYEAVQAFAMRRAMADPAGQWPLNIMVDVPLLLSEQQLAGSNASMLACAGHDAVKLIQSDRWRDEEAFQTLSREFQRRM